jgi:hypothetical protein
MAGSTPGHADGSSLTAKIYAYDIFEISIEYTISTFNWQVENFKSVGVKSAIP